MRLGQTSFVYFVSKLLSSAIGFVATVYFARRLGAGVLGTYFLILAVVSWLRFGGTMGVASAVTKRLSEGDEAEPYLTAGAAVFAALFGLTAVAAVILRSQIDAYVGYDATGPILLLLAVTVGSVFVSAALNGQHRVHVSAMLSSVQSVARAGLQIGAVALGFGLAGLIGGYALGTLLVVVAGAAAMNLRIERPRRRHFERLFDYARYSWLGSVQGLTFSWIDVVVLGFFVSSELVGVYSIAWNVAAFLSIFGSAISATLFPEMSRLSVRRNAEAVADLTETSIAYAGLFLVPGLVGGLLLGERILRIYGDEFAAGASVLWILIAAYLLYEYSRQLLNTLNGIDRPELAFRVNAAFIAGNLAANVVLVWRFGWVGAAVATLLSSAVALGVAYRYVSDQLPIRVPVAELGRQWLAAVLMGAVVYAGLWVERTVSPLNHNFALVAILVSIGAAVYAAALFGLSAQFRRTVLDNVPAALADRG